MDESQNIEYKAIWTHNPYGTSRNAVSRKREWARMRENESFFLASPQNITLKLILRHPEV